MIFKITCDGKTYEVESDKDDVTEFYLFWQIDGVVYCFYNARCLSESLNGNIPRRDIILPISGTTIQRIK